MSAPEVTAAVERGAEALYRREGGVTPLSEVTIGGHSWRDVKRDDVYTVLAAALDVEEMARVDAETSRCSWSIPQEGHPYHEACLYKRERVDGGESHGACWDMPYARATALRAAILGEES